MKTIYLAYLAAMLLVVGTLAAAPLLAMHGPKEVAGLIYNAYAPTCHQWIYRSACVFSDGREHWIGNCIENGKEAVVRTEFTEASKKWDGVFEYSREQIGRNRAERVDYPDSFGYKFPVDTRSLGIYLFMFLAGVSLPFAWKKPKMPHFAWFVAGILPVAVDGTSQLLGFWESTGLVRLGAGALAGAAVSVFLYAIIEREKKRKAEGKTHGSP